MCNCCSEKQDAKVVIPSYFVDDAELSQLSKVYDDDAGLDVAAAEDVVVAPGASVLVSTKLYVAIPAGYMGLLWSRSGLSVRSRIEVGAGCIDSGYRGEVKVHLYNHSNTAVSFNRGDRIAQLLTVPIMCSRYNKVSSLTELPEAGRGENGFGHTGIKSA